MESNKQVFIVAFIVALAVSSYATPGWTNWKNSKAANDSHNLTVGSNLPGDRILVQENIIKSSKWLQIVTVEKSFNATRYEVITKVEAIDQKTNGNGAYATILSGGPGYQTVRLRFKSQRGHGINFVVKVYGR
ncbi:probable salivary secreted peptide [Belonocnema kinseyi]|uniref:probable salivary secreted peptide n=1 Tax=Belonocnema kinseyi TaxID=2817044 RepID=UPI00143DE578|nr:probable salivary secreted peptide [Belonocnema kinseyi]